MSFYFVFDQADELRREEESFILNYCGQTFPGSLDLSMKIRLFKNERLTFLVNNCLYYALRMNILKSSLVLTELNV